jgi:hypothetical protein
MTTTRPAVAKEHSFTGGQYVKGGSASPHDARIAGSSHGYSRQAALHGLASETGRQGIETEGQRAITDVFPTAAGDLPSPHGTQPTPRQERRTCLWRAKSDGIDINDINALDRRPVSGDTLGTLADQFGAFRGGRPMNGSATGYPVFAECGPLSAHSPVLFHRLGTFLYGSISFGTTPYRDFAAPDPKSIPLYPSPGVLL